ncbi:HhH-GPD-type base excision DNA repair protein [Pseudonocardia sp. KRD291]|uniref:HhH-GPD-type base excision DNA repair protein n=1 Tax=Pseudonocardia sp. KRD291 TaxID=2792007 RepID=UPI001C49E4E1|nr:HhH-GPD-type base excision DNA repair protein [Pseudonocardia sp. KRD291]MBW0106135.1 Fe-S cluster assembly protein HesB [Pseudonocardia sp. KRD291]
MTSLCIAQDPDADALLEREPLALLIGMLLDQQIQMEIAFKGPQKLHERLGGLDVRVIADYDPDEFATLATTPPAIHRYGGSMAKRVQALCQYLVENYDGDVEAIWTRDKPTGAEVLRRLKALPGYGEQKAKIFLALLGKQRGVQPYGWRKAAGDYGRANTRLSAADVVDASSLIEVRNTKKANKAAARAASAG